MPTTTWLTAISVLALSLTISGCSALKDDSDEPVVKRVAGTVAQGRPGRWAETCIDRDCTRASATGDYLLNHSKARSAILVADIPERDGTVTSLYSHFRHDDEQTTFLVNINPTTTALLEAWSELRLGRTLVDCLESDCAQDLADGFSEEDQSTAVRFLQNWLSPVWQTQRDPFNDPYRANPTLDWLDRLHDHFHFSNDSTSLSLLDNNGATLAIVSHQALFDPDATPEPLSTAQAQAALALPVQEPADDSPISIRWTATPGLEVDAPVAFSLDASTSSSSVAGELQFELDWVSPQGERRRFNNARAEVNIELGGPHLWVIRVTDSENNQRTLGLTLNASSADLVENPQYGADGSCQTITMTSNSANICEETVDGGMLGACTPTLSGQTLTQKTPAPCSPIAQNGGVFLGICTSVFNELRVFHYDNPLRNTGEPLDEQRVREAERCAAIFGGQWSTEP